MDESELAAAVQPMARAMAPGIFASFGTWLRGGQDRKNLESDRAVVAEMLSSGQTNFRYRGLAMEIETFAEAHQGEIDRQVSNTLNAMSKADSVVDWSKVNLSQFNPEFRHRWISEASNVSDETLQDLWARLLAGELEAPGSVSNDTMSIARGFEQGTCRGVSITLLGGAMQLGRNADGSCELWESGRQFVGALWIVVRCSNAIGPP